MISDTFFYFIFFLLFFFFSGGKLHFCQWEFFAIYHGTAAEQGARPALQQNVLSPTQQPSKSCWLGQIPAVF